MRLLAIRLLGYSDKNKLEMDKTIPEPFYQFLLSESKKDAFEDFAEWDRVLERSYGKRKFIPLNITKEEIYSLTIEKI